MDAQTSQSELGESGSGYCLFGAETLLTRIQELENQIEGARKSEDIEYVHKLRVASRRVRAALNIFEECFPTKQIKKWKKAIKNLTVSSGAARDADVLISFMENYSHSVDARAAQTVRSLMAVQKRRRAVMQSDIVRILDSLKASGVLTAISDRCKTITQSEAKNSKIKTLSTFEKARAHITERLDELLALEPFVHVRGEAAKHHELRIAAKRLRYTMEIFSTVYRIGLSDEIDSMKKFQDILGEMHDYYVWRQDLTAQGNEIPPEARGGFKAFQAHLGRLRRSRYRDFVALWDDAKAQGFFARIRQKIDTAPSSEIVCELLNNKERVALIADVHGNFDALKAVVDDARKSGLEIFLNAGDAVGFGIYPRQVLRALRSPAFISVIGNVDLEVLEALRHSKARVDDDGKDLAIRQLSPQDVAYLQSLPRELRLQIGGRDVLVTHGSPDSIEEHVYPDSPDERLREIGKASSASIMITGHTHLQMNRNVDGVTFVNPGSVGRPVNGDPKAEYAVLSFNPVKVEFHRVNYDVVTLADEMRKKGMPELQVQVLLRAVHQEIITKEETALANKQLWKSRSTISKVRDIAKSFRSDELHAEQIRRIALRIFDRTKQLHSLGAQERYWLECAAILHDIGLSMGTKGHQKSSLRLILNNQTLPFTCEERYIVGSIARYHRKALPNRRHFNLKSLGQEQRKKVIVLASILRLADALDCSHKSVVKKVKLQLSQSNIVLECLVAGQNYLEDQSVSKKKDLFERVFDKDLTVVWRSKRPTKEKRSSSLTRIQELPVDQHLTPVISPPI